MPNKPYRQVHTVIRQNRFPKYLGLMSLPAHVGEFGNVGKDDDGDDHYDNDDDHYNNEPDQTNSFL